MRQRKLWYLAATLMLAALNADARVVKSLLEMRHQGVILQRWDLSCGAAALATLLNEQFGDRVTEREVARELMRRDIYIKHPMLVNLRQGFSLLDLKRYVDARGYRGVGYGKLELADLLRMAPVMVPIHLYGYNHFVIFRGMRGNRVLLADPAWGNRTMTLDRFLRAWIDYPKLGHVGFLVLPADGSTPPNRMAPKDQDFVMLR